MRKSIRIFIYYISFVSAGIGILLLMGIMNNPLGNAASDFGWIMIIAGAIGILLIVLTALKEIWTGGDN